MLEFGKLFEEENICSEKEYVLYVQRNIVVLLNDGTHKLGKMLDASDDYVILEIENAETACIFYGDIKNIFYYGKVTDYQRKRKMGYINGIVAFYKEEEGVMKNLLPLIYYDEFRVTVACHLKKNANQAEICAKDICILEKESRANKMIFNGLRVRLEKKDGSIIHSRIIGSDEEGIYFFQDKVKEKVLFEDIEYISKTTDIGDEIRIIKKDGVRLTGTVEKVSDNSGKIVFEDGEEIIFEDIEDIEYISHSISFSNTSEGRIGNKYYFKDTFFADRYFNFLAEQFRALLKPTEAVTLYFKIGISENGLVAKNIHTSEDDTEESALSNVRLGIIVNYSVDKNMGHIGSSYIEGGLNNKGNVVFWENALIEKYPYDFEYVHIVEYKLFDVGFSPEGAIYDKIDNHYGIKSVEKVLRGIYKKIEIVDGEIIKTPFEENEYIKGHIAEISSQNGIIIGEDGNKYVFSTVCLLDKMPILPDKNLYEVKFFPSNSKKEKRARAITIVAVKSMDTIKETAPVTQTAEPAVLAPAKTILKLTQADKKIIYKAIASQFAPGEEYPMAQISVALNNAGYPNAKYGKHLELLKELTDFLTVRRESATLVMVKFTKDESYGSDELSEVHSEIVFGEKDLEPDKNHRYEYGIINICFVNTIGLIHMQYFNKHSGAIDENSISHDLVQFVPNLAQYDFKMSTSKYSYLVKFVRGEKVYNEGLKREVDGINYAYPIIFVERFEKKQYKIIEILPGKLRWEKSGENTIQSKNSDIEDIPEIDKQFEKIISGESYFVILSNGKKELRICENESVSFEEIMKADDSVAKIYRLGVVTQIDFDKETGVISNMFPFDFSVMELKTLNILKTLKGCTRGTVQVCFSYSNGQITEISRVGIDFLSQIIWEKEIVTGYNTEKKEIYCGDKIHYLTVSSDGWVYKLFSSKMIENRDVFVREGKQAVKVGDDIVLQKVIVDIHCTVETGIIRYNDVKDQYMAYRNQTAFCPIKGDRKLLNELIEEETQVYFFTSESQKELVAYISDRQDEEDILEDEVYEETISGNIETFPLTEYYISQSKEEVFNFPNDLAADSSGRFNAKGKDAVKWLIGGREFLRQMRAAFIMMNENIEFVVMNDKKGISYKKSAVKIVTDAYVRKIREIITNPNGVYGEYAYLISGILNGYSGQDSFREKLICYLVAPDFVSRHEMSSVITSKSSISELISKGIKEPAGLLGHMMLLDDNSFSLVMSAISEDAGPGDSLVAYISDKYKEFISLEAVEKPVEDLCARIRAAFNKERVRVNHALTDDSLGIYERVDKALQIANVLFIDFLSGDDSGHFISLANCIKKNRELQVEPQFDRRVEGLIGIVREISDIEGEIKNHPTKYAFEMLYKNGILDSVRRNIEADIDELYKKAKPNIECYPDEAEILRTADTVYLILKNTGENMYQGVYLQAALNVRIDLESASIGVEVEKEPVAGSRDIVSNGSTSAAVSIDLSSLSDEEDSVTLSYTIKYDYYAGYKQVETGENSGSITLQITEGTGTFIDKTGIENPYSESVDNPSLSDDMFYGRADEIQAIWKHIVKGESFIPGKAVILYGQKKCGKTALINKIKNKISSNSNLKDSSIIISFGNILSETCNDLSQFFDGFYKGVLKRFMTAIRKDHRDVYEMIERENIIIPNLDSNISASDFYSFFNEFLVADDHKHAIILIMDEFTSLTTRIKRNRDYSDIPIFIKTFSQLGFIQIIIGHDSMIKSFEQLNVINMTAEFAKKINLTAFKEDDARRLIVEPMENTFGINVYGTQLGELAIKSLLDLSGCSPSYLMKLCNQICEGYLEDERTYINNYSAREIIDDYVDTLSASYFDILLTEDGDDDIIGLQLMETDTFKYMKAIAQKSYETVTRDCPYDTECEGMDVEKIDSVRSLLEGRQVLEIHNGRVKIHVGLFIEYIIRKFGR